MAHRMLEDCRANYYYRNTYTRYYKTGQQRRRYWRGRLVITDLDTVTRIESYQGVIYGTATGGRPMVLAVAVIRGERVRVVFPTIGTYMSCRAEDNVSPEEWQHLARYLAAEASGFALSCSSSASNSTLIPP
ncbi:hypothetical protein TEQG_08082 [Trichophyton equinum CBS 127.97]|uniref:Uncharacterized protein n=1 Tax=Trichophyton equinum (strain ATCC MYA-4606 / CBS 127.97) TaxID=559882 RepID=F2Q4I6_TRIEC|nr:hypothetical protein TEQG_08082 [Trichophyton equinum CBS 127.97]